MQSQTRDRTHDRVEKQHGAFYDNLKNKIAACIARASRPDEIKFGR